MRLTIYRLFTVMLLVILLVVFAFFIPQFFVLASQAQNQTEPLTPEKETIVEGEFFRSLEISPSDSNEITIYKFFKNFDSFFINEKIGLNITYNPFTLVLKGNNWYDINTGELTRMAIEGVRNFSRYDTQFQIGTDAKQTLSTADFRDVAYDGSLDFFNNDCWSTTTNNALNAMASSPSPCKIFVHGTTTNLFKSRVKIRVAWRDDSATSSSGRDVVEVVITLCNDNSMTV